MDYNKLAEMTPNKQEPLNLFFEINLDDIMGDDLPKDAPLEEKLQDEGLMSAIYVNHLCPLMIIAELVVACCYGKTAIKTWMKENPNKSLIQMFDANDWTLGIFMVLNYSPRWRWDFLDEGERSKKRPRGKWTAWLVKRVYLQSRKLKNIQEIAEGRKGMLKLIFYKSQMFVLSNIL